MQGLSEGKTGFDFDVADLDTIHSYRLKLIKRERIESPYGQQQTVRLETQHNDKRAHFTIWCSQSLDYLPVLIRKTEPDGSEVELQLTIWKQRP